MSRLIDADALLQEHCEGCTADIREGCKTDPVCASAMWVVDAPTVDAVEVVRCKDCKHYRQNCWGGEDDMWCMCWSDWIPTEPDDYCSNGERKSDGEIH